MSAAPTDFDTFNHSLMIAIPVFNRMGHCQRLLESLHASRDLLPANVHAFDDASHEFAPEQLRGLLHPEAQLLRFSQHSGSADQALMRIFQRFVHSPTHQHLALLDCGLIVADGWLRAAWLGTVRAHGVLSLLNTPMHRTEHLIEGTPTMLVKQSLGWMGVIWSKPVVADLLQHVPMSPQYSQAICQHLRARLPLCCLLESQVQHVGVPAHSLQRGPFEHGVGFAPGNDTTARILARETEKLILGLMRR